MIGSEELLSNHLLNSSTRARKLSTIVKSARSTLACGLVVGRCISVRFYFTPECLTLGAGADRLWLLRREALAMGEYFKPRRRKIGVLTLVMACVIAAGWVRSLTRADLVMLQRGNYTFSVESMCGEISFGRLASGNNNPRWIWHSSEISPATWRVCDQYGNPQPVDHLTEDIESIEWRFDRFGFHFGAGNGAQGRDEIYAFPYLSIVIPLTLLSAYLLLSKPRTKPKSSQSLEPESSANETMAI